HVKARTLPSVLAVFRFEPRTLRGATAIVRDLQGQILDRSSAVLCCSRDCAPDGIERLRESTGTDGRFTIIDATFDGGESRERAPSGTFDTILVSSGGIRLREHCLYLFAAAAEMNPDARLIYADQDQLDRDGRRIDPWFKPQFSGDAGRDRPRR
ncbi:MAG: hypothetical protein ABI369_04685, partial [Acetobacteraceae bacterium]